MKVKGFTPDQIDLLGKYVKKRIDRSKGSDEIKDSVSLSFNNREESETVFIKPDSFSKDMKKTLEDMGVTVDKEFSALGGYSAKLDPDTTARLIDKGYKVYSNPNLKLIPEPPPEEMNGNMNSPTQLATGFGDSVLKMNVSSPAVGASSVNEMGYTGKGIGVFVIDSGIAPHPDIADRYKESIDFVNGRNGVQNATDENGHASHVGGIVASSGKVSQGIYRGVAPEADLVSAKVVDSTGGGNVVEVANRVVEAINWAINHQSEFNIRVINMSIGLPHIMPDAEPINESVNKAIEAGIVVVAAAGNSGPGAGTVNCEPGDNPNVITVGASDDHNTVTRDDDTIASFSSRGPTPKGIVKPDIIAPGTEVMSLNIPGSELDKQAKQAGQLRDMVTNANSPQLKQLANVLIHQGSLPPDTINLSDEQIRKLLLGAIPNMPVDGDVEIGGIRGSAYIGIPGTSMASPIVAGVVADMLQANPLLSPKDVKDILMSTADKFPNEDVNTQGAGYLNTQKAIDKALSFKKS